MRVLMIIPAYNEEDNIANTVRQIIDFNGLQSEVKLDYLIINDGSSDHTLDVCKENGFRVVSHVCNQGIGAAVQTGYRYANRYNYDAAVQFDGDGQHDISSLPDLLDALQDADLVIGSRFVDENKTFQSTKMRRVEIHILSFLIRLTTGNRILDCTSGYRAASQKVIKQFDSDYPQDYPEPESIVQLALQGYRIREIPAKMKPRTGGQSSIRTWKSCLYMIKVSLAILITSIGGSEV